MASILFIEIRKLTFFQYCFFFLFTCVHYSFPTVCWLCFDSGKLWKRSLFATLFICLDLSGHSATFAKSVAMLGNTEEHTVLSRALSQLSELEERIEHLHANQSQHDYDLFCELFYYYWQFYYSRKTELKKS